LIRSERIVFIRKYGFLLSAIFLAEKARDTDSIRAKEQGLGTFTMIKKKPNLSDLKETPCHQNTHFYFFFLSFAVSQATAKSCEKEPPFLWVVVLTSPL
jgi:hypothetical protein